MVEEPREGPYCWVTWTTRLLSGEAQCVWSSWHKVNFKYQKRDSGFDFARWNAEHNELLGKRAKALRDQGFTVSVEGQNSFKLKGQNGLLLSGKPDIRAIGPDGIQIDDAKTGQVRDSDACQIQIYQVVAPRVWPHFGHLPVTGHAVYPSQVIAVPPPDEGFKRRFRELMDTLADTRPPQKVPSASECQWCDVATCSERVSGDSELVATDLF